MRCYESIYKSIQFSCLILLCTKLVDRWRVQFFAGPWFVNTTIAFIVAVRL